MRPFLRYRLELPPRGTSGFCLPFRPVAVLSDIFLICLEINLIFLNKHGVSAEWVSKTYTR